MEHVEITKKTLRQFGLMVGGIFLFIGLWPFVWRQEAVRIWVVVPGALLAAAGLMRAGRIETRVPRMDVGRACDGMGQHPYYFRDPVLWRGDADGVVHEIDRS